EACQKTRFDQQARGEVPRGVGDRQGFERHLAPELRILREINAPHAALAEPAQYPVPGARQVGQVGNLFEMADDFVTQHGSSAAIRKPPSLTPAALVRRPEGGAPRGGIPRRRRSAPTASGAERGGIRAARTPGGWSRRSS